MTIGDTMREILRQYNESVSLSAGTVPYAFRGAHYVYMNRGVFMVRPFGTHRRYRYYFGAYPTGLNGEVFWNFGVLGEDRDNEQLRHLHRPTPHLQ